MNSFEEQLSGGHPNSLGNTISVVDQVLETPSKLNMLFDTYGSKDAVVRMRVSNAIKRICRSKPGWVVPYLDVLISEIALIDQASIQWSLAQLFLLLENELSDTQRKKAISIMLNNIENNQDWIVLNMTMITLGKWAKKDSSLRAYLLPHLQRLEKDNRKSVASKAGKTIQSLS